MTYRDSLSKAPTINIGHNDVYIVKTKSEPDLINLAEIDATDYLGNNINNRIELHTEDISFDQPGQYRIGVSVSDSENNYSESSFLLHIVNSYQNLPPEWRLASNTTKRHHYFMWIVIIIILLIVALFGINKVNSLKSQNEQQQTSINQQNTKNDNLKSSLSEEKSKNQNLLNILKDITSSVDTFKNDNNQENFQNKLSDIQSEVNNLKGELDNNDTSLSNTLDKLTTLINNLQQSNSAQDANNLLQDSNIDSIISKLNDFISELKGK